MRILPNIPYGSINVAPAADFLIEIVGSLKYFMDRWRNRKNAPQLRVMVTDENGKHHARANFEEAFGFSGYQTTEATESDVRLRGGSYDENIRLAPYTYRNEVTPISTPASSAASPRFAAGSQYPPPNQEIPLGELRRAHVHSPDPAELKRFDADPKGA